MVSLHFGQPEKSHDPERVFQTVCFSVRELKKHFTYSHEIWHVALLYRYLEIINSWQ